MGFDSASTGRSPPGQESAENWPLLPAPCYVRGSCVRVFAHVQLLASAFLHNSHAFKQTFCGTRARKRQLQEVHLMTRGPDFLVTASSHGFGGCCPLVR